MLVVQTVLGNILEPCFKSEISCTTIKIGLVMLVTIQLVLVCVVLVQGRSLACIGFPGLGDATHAHHRYHTTNICHNVVLGSYWLTASLYSIVPGLGGPSQSLVTSKGIWHFTNTLCLTQLMRKVLGHLIYSL